MECCICLENFPIGPQNSKLVSMPCCKPPSASASPLCSACCMMLVERGDFPSTGRCPLCRAFFRVTSASPNSAVQVESLRDVAQCACCMQLRVIVRDDHRFCDACVLGRRHCLRYECEGCHGIQRIPHPMWRYQATPATFGTETWACQRCGVFTRWRIAGQDVHLVPNADAPESWGRREVWLEELRAMRTQQVTCTQVLLRLCSPLGLLAVAFVVRALLFP
jgi:hypothetical protein